MAKMEHKLAPPCALKHPLECKMFVSKCYVEREIKFFYLVWNVTNYKSMRQGGVYYKNVQSIGWCLQILKTREDVRVLIYCDASTESIACYVSPNWRQDGLFTIPYDFDRFDAGKFKLIFPRGSVRNPENNTDPDVLGLHFRYNMSENDWRNPTGCKGVDVQERGLFTDKLADMLESGKYADCVVRTSNRTFGVHRIVLASRSKVLRRHFEGVGSDELTSDVPSECVKLVLRYAYSGKLDLRNLGERQVWEVLKLAIEWEMELLELRCVSFLIIACDSNARKIRRAAEEKGARLSEKSRKFLKYVEAS